MRLFVNINYFQFAATNRLLVLNAKALYHADKLDLLIQNVVQVLVSVRLCVLVKLFTNFAGSTVEKTAVNVAHDFVIDEFEVRIILGEELDLF